MTEKELGAVIEKMPKNMNVSMGQAIIEAADKLEGKARSAFIDSEILKFKEQFADELSLTAPEILQSNQQGQIYEMMDKVEKIADLLNDFAMDYNFSDDLAPSRDTLDAYNKSIRAGNDFTNDKQIEIISTWVCHYKHIMRRISMIEDYVETISDTLQQMDNDLVMTSMRSA